MNPIHIIRSLVCAFLGATASLSAGELVLNRYFTDHMVLQRDKPLVIRGVAQKGAAVTVAFHDQKASAQADAEGRWRVTLEPVAASQSPRSLTVSSGNEQITLEDVLVGDVILHARQTSIDLSLGRDETGRKVAASHLSNPLFRAVRIRALPSVEPLHDLPVEASSGWHKVDRESALGMTASAYYVGRDLAGEVGVPVGIVDLNMGDGFGNSWLSREALMETGKFYKDWKRDRPDKEVAEHVLKYEKLLECEIEGVKFWHGDPGPPENTLRRPLFPAGRYNSTMHPLGGTAFKAALVQLGNDYPYVFYNELYNSEDPFAPDRLDLVYDKTYNLRKVGFSMEPKVIPRVASEWRKYLGDESLPFGLIVPPGSELNTMGQHHREMRELQRQIAEDLPAVDIILPGTEHIPFSAQPADEALLAERSLRWLLGTVYQMPEVVASGPDFERFEASYNAATIYFKAGTAQGLRSTGDALDHFEAADVEGDYVPATAAIEGETIRLVAEDITRIARIRYNWKHQPDQGLVNAAGLPAIPFRSERAPYHWLVRNDVEDVPEEYSLPANQWAKSDVTLFNMKTAGSGYDNFTGWVGPAGFKTAPFGPNMRVTEVTEGSPAEGRVLVGDTIYSANGRMLGEKAWEVMAAAITESETSQAGGKLVLGLRRGAENMEVELQLEVMGTYSSTAPFKCLKTEKIVKNLEEYLVKNDADGGFLNSDALFLLATGNPELQGYVRRAVYKILEEEIKPAPLDGRKAGKSWYNSADALLLGEYYLATGDRNVLPHLKYACDKLASMQQPEGGWRHNYPGGGNYGYISVAGMPGVMGMHFAKLAGVDIDLDSYELGVQHYQRHRAETGQIIYGMGHMHRHIPVRFEPEQMLNGKMNSMNGAVSCGGILMDFINDHRSSQFCSAISVYAYNNTHGGHGGNFWNNFWTPLGASFHSRSAFIYFEKNYRWYRELSRMHDGSLIGGGRPTAGYGIALLTPRQRIRIAGATDSPFEADAPEALRPALEAYWKRDYATAQTRVEALLNDSKALIAEGKLTREELPALENFARAVLELQQSIEADLKRMDTMILAGDPGRAITFLPGLEGVMPPDDTRLVAMQGRLASLSAALKSRKKSDAASEAEVDSVELDLARIRKLVDDGKLEEAATYVSSVIEGMGKKDDRLLAMRKTIEEIKADAEQPEPEPRKWETILIDNQFDGPGPVRRRPSGSIYTTRLEKPNLWRIKVIEGMSQAPEGWNQPDFDASDWMETDLPSSWHLYHTALLRTTFQVEDKSRYDALALHAWVLRQQGMEIYLNGTLIGKVSGVGNRTILQGEFKPSVLDILKNGENTIAIKGRNNWRWGHRDFYVYNGGFDFNLDARLKEGL